jgi:hypothetical protein
VDIEIFRRKVVAGAYEFTQHAKDEAANDDLDTEDIETVILTGKVARVLTKDPRGKRFVILGLTRDKEEVELVCRLLPSGRMRIITVYLKG